MKKLIFIICALAALSINSFADIPGPGKKPRPTQRTLKLETRPGPTPAPDATPSPTPLPAEYTANMGIYFNKDEKIPVLNIRRAALQKLMASGGDQLEVENTADLGASGPMITPLQTIISGGLFSLAFVFGGVWMFRSRGKSRVGAGAMVIIAITGIGATVFANSPPPRVVTITSRIFDRSTLAYGFAHNKVKIRIIEEKDFTSGYSNRSDVELIVPKEEE